MVYILSRSMEADMFAKIKRIDILSRSMEADMFAKIMRINILSRSMEADMFAKIKRIDIKCPEVWRLMYLLKWSNVLFRSVVDFVVSICITTYAITMDVTLVVETAERYFVYFVAPKLMFLAPYSFHFMV